MKAWRIFLEFAGNGCIVMPSIPVLWFGDYNAYNVSQRKIVSVSINPSYREFVAENGNSSVALRFPKAAHLVGKRCISSSDLYDYRMALNAYFSENPYMDFFNQWAKFLAPLNASYYTGDKPNTAIHLDLFTPLATSKKWNDTSKADRDRLKSGFKPIISDLLDVLKPDVFLSSRVEIFDLMGISPSSPSSPSSSSSSLAGLQIGRSGKGQTVLYGKSNRRTIWGKVPIQEVQNLIDTGTI